MKILIYGGQAEEKNRIAEILKAILKIAGKKVQLIDGDSKKTKRDVDVVIKVTQ